MVAELVYHMHLPLKQIARLTEYQIRWIYFRDRDEHCRLKRPGQEDGDGYDWDSPAGTRVKHSAGFSEGWYKNVKRFQSDKWLGKIVDGETFHGWSDEQIEQQWQEYLATHPSLITHLGRGQRQQPANGGGGKPVAEERFKQGQFQQGEGYRKES